MNVTTGKYDGLAFSPDHEILNGDRMVPNFTKPCCHTLCCFIHGI